MADEKDQVQNAIQWEHQAACHPKILDAENCLIDWQGRKKLAIVGFASSTRDKAPFDNPEWVVWGLNQLYRHVPRADAWIDIHRDFNAPGKVVEGTDFDGWLKSIPIPVFMAETHPEIPTSVRFPLEQIIDKFGADYFTSTISYMIAYGIWAGFTTIGIWGVDLIVGKEYFHQKACAEFWLGVASASGVEVKLPAETAIMKAGYRYGYEDERKLGIITVDEIRARLVRIEKRRDELMTELRTVDGFRQDCAYWLELAELRARGGYVPPAEGNTT
jgi:hypothetical protein